MVLSAIGESNEAVIKMAKMYVFDTRSRHGLGRSLRSHTIIKRELGHGSGDTGVDKAVAAFLGGRPRPFDYLIAYCLTGYWGPGSVRSLA